MDEVADAAGHDVLSAAEARDGGHSTGDGTLDGTLDHVDGARAGVGDAAGSVGDAAGNVGSVDGDLDELTAALEGADGLDIDERLALLRHAQEAIAGALEGLDGL